MTFIYVLNLEGGKYYIHKSDYNELSLSDLKKEINKEWTCKFHPLNIEKIIEDCDDYDEDKYTIMYMDKYGMNNVRGGTFSFTLIYRYQIDTLVKMSKNKYNTCFICGDKNHKEYECKEKYDYCFYIFENDDECYNSENEYDCDLDNASDKTILDNLSLYDSNEIADIFNGSYSDQENIVNV